LGCKLLWIDGCRESVDSFWGKRQFDSKRFVFCFFFLTFSFVFEFMFAFVQNGSTPIKVAAGRGHEKVLKLLHENGADPNAMDVCSVFSLSFSFLR